MLCACAHHPAFWNVPRKLFFFLIKKEPFAFTEAGQFKPFVPAETLKSCALIRLHPCGSRRCIWVLLILWCLFAGAGIAGLKGPRYPLWKEDVPCSGNESTVGYEVYEHNNECRATEVTGQDWSSEVVARLLQDWDLGRVAVSCQEMRNACWNSSESLGARCSLCSLWWEDSVAEECREPGTSSVTASESFSLTVDGLRQIGEGCPFF